MVRNGQVDSIEAIKNFNRTVIKLGEDLHKPVVATGDSHFQEPEDWIYRAVLQAGNGFKDADNQAPLYFRTTPDMLEDFSYLPQEKAYEIVVTNPNKIAATIDNNLRAIPKGTYPPSIPGAEQELRDDTWKHAARDYGSPLPNVLQKRLKKELDSICGHGYAVLYVIAVRLVSRTSPAFRRSTRCRRITSAPTASTASGSTTVFTSTASICPTKTARSAASR